MKTKIFRVPDPDGHVYIIADGFNEALKTYQKWIVSESEGQETMFNPPEPSALELLADGTNYDVIIDGRRP